MKSKMVRHAAIACALAVTAAGCAEERAPINRVQANALAKSFFVGEDLVGTQDDPEFYTQATLIDAGYGTSQSGLFPSTYTQEVARIKWQVTEDMLLGRLTYERIADSDGKGAGAASTDGQIVVAYAIQKHFDIRRSYNPSTGEELNVIEENASDRPWYEREYMRVDWSKNLQTDTYDFDTLSLLGIFGGVSYAPLAYYVNDPNDADAPHFDAETGYFDVTNKAFATPGEVDLSHFGWGIDSFPSCFLPPEFSGGTEPIGNCNPSELTIRQAFRRVPKEGDAAFTDYQPQNWDGKRFQSYGAFYKDRFGYSRNYGMTDDKWYRFINRYNIWERSHYYDDPVNATGHVTCFTPETTPYGWDPNRDDDFNGTDDECEEVTNRTGYPGSKCDIHTQKCTLPYRLRVAKPIPWYVTNGSNYEYYRSTDWATNDHDVAMRHAIQAAKYAECLATGEGDSAVCATNYPVYFGQQDDHLEAKQLAREVDDCRQGLTYPEYGEIRTEAREQACVALADSVAALRSENGARPMDPGVIALAKMPQQIVLCHSPVQWDDPAACGGNDIRLPQGITAEMCNTEYKDRVNPDLYTVCKAARNVRRGDLRYHLVNMLVEPHSPSPWGIYTDAHDPLTGETFSAAINVWTHVNDLWSQGVMDRIRYIKGELSTEEVTEGTYVREWSKAAESASGGAGMAPRMTGVERAKRIAAFAEVDTETVAKMKRGSMAGIHEAARAVRNEVRTIRAELGAPSTMSAVYKARMQAVAGTEVEAQLITPMMQQYAGTSSLPSDASAHYASVLRGLNPTHLKEMRNMYQQALAERGTCIYNEAPAPMAIVGLADALERKFGNFDPAQDSANQWVRAERMRHYLAQRAHYAVIVHEMGHSVGERHNFVSSSDAYNYRPQYWQLRTNDGAITRHCGCNPGESDDATACGTYEEDGSQCIGPRYFDPVSANERDNMIWMWMHSSVMDYAGEYSQDMLGLGAYDFGAHRMFYGDTVAVFSDPSYAIGQPRSSGMVSKMDSFGGILGIQPEFNGEDIHYSRINENYEVIKDCAPVTVENYRPASWNDEVDGIWDPIADGFIVSVNGQYTKCRQQKVDYVPWTRLHEPAGAELTNVGFYQGGPSIDNVGRIRVPYGFATDRWADLGNASVYRHDNGADAYEIFDFLATQGEVHHIFDNYRRGRQTFSVRSASGRTMSRYHEKIRDGAKGLGLLANIYRDFFMANGWVYDGEVGKEGWAYIASQFFADNILASGMVFDHFAVSMARPEIGGHYREDGVLRSEEDSQANMTFNEVNMYNGATGFYGNIAYGGKPIENRLAEDQGEFDADFTINAGSYYDKVYAPYLLTESVDNFISDSRQDFVDGRYRAVSMADLFPNGFRRWLANNLTGDDQIKGLRLAAGPSGNVLIDEQFYPQDGIGITQWWGSEPRVCFPASGTTVCETYGAEASGIFNPRQPANTVPIDPQIGYEQQKFLITMTMTYLPSNQRVQWADMMRLYQLGVESDPTFQNRIELHDPTGKVYVAMTFGKEDIFGKTVHRGIAARVLEYANELVRDAYETTDGPDIDGDGTPDWYIPVIDPTTGKPSVLYDPNMQFIDPVSGAFQSEIPGCNATDNSECPCSANKACYLLERYVSVPYFLWQNGMAFGLPEGSPKGLY